MTSFSAVHQFHSGVSAGDAITQQMLMLQAQLRAMGYASEVFGAHIDPRLQGTVKAIEHYSGSDDELLLFHHSMGSDAFDEVITLPNCIVTVYHNVTPEHFFETSGWRAYSRLGQEQLRFLAARSRLGIADSNYNRREMLAAGFSEVDVLPVRTDYRSFASSRVNGRGHLDWLFVGRIVANKAQHELVRAFAVYSRAYAPNARLVLVGDLSHDDYVRRVHAEVDRFRLGGRVVMVGKVPDTKLTSAFRSSGVYVSLSAHEGFGVPLLEAMAAGLPVIAFAAAAVPETMGGAGILLREKDPASVAAVVRSVEVDDGLRDRLVSRQYERVRQIQSFDTEALLRKVIGAAGGSLRPLEVQVQGPFETTYSLAVLNRRLAESLDERARHRVSIYATEGPGDYVPNGADLDRHPHAARLYERSASVPYPDVVIRQMYPPRVIDSPGGITIQYFGWEESRLPQEVVDDFNHYVTAIGAMSTFVHDVLRGSGVTIPICVVGVGVDPPDPKARLVAPELQDLAGFRFVHISSGFPRKGVDVLLRAYFASFSGADDVSLVLKTFPNPHNDVATLIEDLRSAHGDPPTVHWIDRDLDSDGISGLYNLASCYVHPSRGEGFGLPVAEAMAAGVPVISVAYSGLADFVSDSTAVTVPYRVEPARTHLSVAGSVWAEPDQDALAREMRHIYSGLADAKTQTRVKTAQELILDRFSWEAVAARWADCVAVAQSGVGRPRVAMISTWNSRCGIAENTRYIVSALRDHFELEIHADRRNEVIDPNAEGGVTRTWDREDLDLSHLEIELRASMAEILHFQFNFGFFNLAELGGLIERQLPHRAVILTLHRTKDIVSMGRTLSLTPVAGLLRCVDQIIVHQDSDRRHLAELGIVRNVAVVPLGAPPPPSVSPAEARRRLGLGDRPLLGAFGFLLPHKGLLDLLHVLDRLRAEIPDVCLFAACALHPDTPPSYEEEVRAFIADRNLAANVVLITEFLADTAAQLLLRGTDVIVLPYHQTEESSSATLRFVLPLEIPIVTTDLAIFDDAREAVLTVPRGDETELLSAIRRVLLDGPLAATLARKAGAAAQKFRWETITAEHRQIYASVLAKRRQARHT